MNISQLLAALASRIGTFLAGMLGTLVALSPGQFATLEAAIAAICLIGIDLLVVFSRKRWGKGE